MDHNVAIIMSEPLSALGLKQLLLDHFGVQAHVVDAPEQFTQAVAENTNLLITDETAFVSHLNLFLPRSARTIVLSSSRQFSDTSVTMVSTAFGINHVVNKLGQVIKSNDTQQASTNLLSPRETDVLRLIVSGCLNKEIADQLNISINTVLTHRKNITAKLGIKSVSGLTFYAMMNGLIAPK